MSFDYRGRMLRKLRVTRVLFGLALSALAMVVWLRMGMTQLWPKLLRVDTAPSSAMPFSESNPAVDFSGLKSVANVLDMHSVANVSNVHSVVNVSDSHPVVNASDSHSKFSCLSRSHQYMYRKQEYEFPLSGSLTAALADYTRMFSRCGGYGEDEVDLRCQYVVYHEGWEGLGNRLLSLVTAFTYALVTNRALLTVENRGHLGALLCEPFLSRTWILPSPVMNSVLSQAVSLDDAIASHFVNTSAVWVNLRHSQSTEAGAFFSSEAQQGLQNVTWVIWESNQYYIPRLFMLSNFWSTLSNWFPDVSHVFTQLGRVLCVPRNDVWETIQKLQDSEMLQVGIQVRRHGVSDDAEFSETVYDRIMKCVEDLVPKQGVSASVLVTSLQSVYWEKMRERWNGGPEVKFVMVSHEGRERYSYEQARKALVEIWLLSFCSTALVTSSWSTFGYVAQGLAGMRPRILNIRGGKHMEWEPACSDGQSPEPCLHYPFLDAAIPLSSSINSEAPAPSINSEAPTPSNNSEAPAPTKTEHEVWMARHILGCQDEVNGLQLVSL